jgi:hypothetical protein
MTAPSPQTWTLRFKSRKTTVLLHVDPLHTFTTIKSHLYDALNETGLQDPESGESIPLPDSPSDIQFGRPIDVHDAQQGFQLGEWEIVADENDDDGGKGKGKAKAGSKSGGGATAGVGNVKDCPKGAGLKDGAVLAFRWAGDGTWDGSEDDAEQEIGEGANMWGVKLASFEDAYGVTNETDVGGGREFEG